MPGDFIREDNQGQAVPVTGFTPSPVEAINGVDVVSFLLSQSLVASSQDPDALWNELFPLSDQPLLSGTFTFPGSYPGPATNVTFSNGTTRVYWNMAVVNVALDGVTSGDDAYSVFCPGAQQMPATSAASSSATPTTSETPAHSPTALGYAQPVIKHGAGSVAGYYLNETGLTDIAVLQVKDFHLPSHYPAGCEKEFQMVVQKFFEAAVRTGRRKLIIDLQGNRGGRPNG